MTEVATGQLTIVDANDGAYAYTATVYAQQFGTPDTPTGGSFDFGTKNLTVPGVPNSATNWSASIPTSSTTPTYVSTFLFFAQPPATTAAGGTWSIPVSFVVSGTNAISGQLSNDSVNIPASSAGVVASGTPYNGSGTEVRVYDGATLLNYNGTGTTKGTWTVSASGTGITASVTKDTLGTAPFQYVRYGNHSLITADVASITYTITGKSSTDVSFSFIKTQVLIKNKAGVQGPTVQITTNRAATFVSTDDVLASSQTDLSFTATTSGITATSYEWTFYTDSSTEPITSSAMGVALGGTPTGKTCTLTQAQFAAAIADIKSLKVVCVVNGDADYTDHITVTRLDNSTAAPGATVGANLLNTYIIPTGTIPTSLELSTGVNAMTYTPVIGRLDRSGGLSMLSGVNLNTATDETILNTVATNIVTTTLAHGYAQQNCVVYTHNGTTISGLVSGTCYYVIYLSENTFKLSATIPTATNGTGTAIVLGAVTVGTTYKFNAVDYITTTAAHNYNQQMTVKYIHSLGGTTISGLAFQNNYYLVYLSTNTFALSTSAANAGTLSGGVVSSINLGAITAGTTYNFMSFGWYGSSGYSTTSCVQVSFTTVANLLYGALSRYMIGLNRDPSLDGSYLSLDYAIHILGAQQQIYESGVRVLKTGATNLYTVGDTFSIIYNGANLVNYYRNGILFYTTYLVTPITVPLYMDSAFLEYGSICTALNFINSSAYVAPVLLTAHNVTGLVHAGNAGDHISDNIISTATVIPKAVSEFHSVVNVGEALGTGEYVQNGAGGIWNVRKVASISVEGDPYSEILVLIGLSNLHNQGTSQNSLGIYAQRQSSNISRYTTGYYSPAPVGQAYEPSLATTSNWYVTAPYTITFNAATAVNITTGIFTTVASNYYTGSRVRYVDAYNTGVIGNLASNTEYYIIKLTATTFKLAATFEDALDKVPIPISITAVGTGIHQFESPYYTYELYTLQYTKSIIVTGGATGGVNTSTEVFTISSMFPNGIGNGDRIFTGMDVLYCNQTGGDDIAPLVNVTTYYVIMVTGTTFKLATTKANAVAAVPVAINITGTGTAGFHEFVGIKKWILSSGDTSFNIGRHTVFTNQVTNSTLVSDTGSMGAAATDTINFYIETNSNDTRTPDYITVDTTLSILVSKR